MLKVSLLGQFEVQKDGVLLSIPSRPAQSLLAYLLLTVGTEHRREKLAGLLWPDSSEENARNNLRTALWRLRKVLGSDANKRPYLLADDLSITFNQQSDYWVDTSVLECGASAQATTEDLHRFLTHYRGELLPGFYEDWVVLERVRLQAVFEQEVERLLDHLIGERRWAEVLEWGERWIAFGQTPEPAYRALMVAHNELGNHARIAATYQRCVEALRRDLDVEPAEETRALFERLRAEDEGKGPQVTPGPREKKDDIIIPPVSPFIPAASRKDEPPVTGESRSPLNAEIGRGKLGVVDGAHDQGIEPSSPELTALAAQTTNLPIPLSSFIGRKKESAELKELVTTTRLLTLTGAGGSGKTRLAIQVAAALMDNFQDGVWWVDLAPLTDAALVAHAMAQGLGLREAPGQTLTDTLTSFLRHKRLLLVLDNCEHLIFACAQLADDLLTQCPNLRILATSREALGITGEMVYQVPTLSLPKPRRLMPTELLIEYEGIHLFVERAGAVKPDFRLTEQNATSVLQICQQLDGIPLALELAAARTKLLTVDHIAERLNDRFNLLTQGSRTALPRQQTLRATIDWSYDSLSEEARILFRRLSVFAGGFNLESAEGVCSEDPLGPRAVLDLLTRLVDRSLVKVERQGDYTRYRMLETIREYARERLDESGDTHRLRQRHRDFFVALAEQTEPKLKSAEQFAGLDRLELEHDNLRAAWDCAIESDAELALRLASAMLDFWSMRGDPSEGRQWLAQLLPRTNGWGQTAKRAHAFALAGRLTYLQRDFALAQRLLEEALAIARISSDKRAIAFALLWLGWTAHRHRGDETARAFTEECLAIYQDLQDQWGMAMTFYHLGGVAASEAHYAEAEEEYMKSLANFQELGDKFRMGYALNGLGELARLLGDYEQAGKFYEEHIGILREHRSPVALVIPLVNLAWVSLRRGGYGEANALFEESLKLSNEYGNKTAMVDCLAGFAGLLGMTGKPEHAARLFGAVEALLESIGMARRMDPSDQKEVDYYVAAIRAQLDEASIAKAWAEGRTMTLEQAISYALDNRSK